MAKYMRVGELAKREGVSPAAVSQRIRRSGVKRGPQGKIDVADYERAKAAPGSQPGSATARDQYWRAKAALALMDAQERQGKLIPYESVSRLMTNIAMLVKTDMLAIPNAIAPDLVGKDVVDISTLLTTAIKDALRHLKDKYDDKS